MAAAAAAASARHRRRTRGLRRAASAVDAGGKDRHLARQILAAASGAFGLRFTARHQGFERILTAFTSIFVNRHLVLFHRLRVLDQHSAGGFGMEKADHPGQPFAGALID